MLLLGLLPLARVSAQESSLAQTLIITELMPGSAASASQEFIELHNVGADPLDLTGWQVQYLSAANTDWSKASRTIELTGSIDPDAYLLIASNDYLAQAPVHYAATLAQSGGHVRVINSANTAQHDVVGWGTAIAALAAPAQAPKPGQSLARATTPDGLYVTAVNNANDFSVYEVPSPGEENKATTEVVTEPESTELEPEVNEDAEPITWPDIRITELLPNPTAPALDSESEFVELYNASAAAVDLTGYVIKTGTKLSYSYTIEGVSIESGGYLALTSGQTSLTLSNTAGKAVLFAPDGQQLFETKPYEKAAEGQSWILNGEDWTWTTAPTQAAENILNAPVLGLSLQLPKTKTPTSKKSAAPKSSKTSTKKPKTTKSSSKSNEKENDSVVAATSSQNPTRPLHPLVLAGIGSVVVLYALYEYRHDMANRLRQFRTNRAARRATRGAVKATSGH